MMAVGRLADDGRWLLSSRDSSLLLLPLFIIIFSLGLGISDRSKMIEGLDRLRNFG